MAKPFASAADTERQQATLVALAEGVYGYISDFDPNTGLIFGDGSDESGCLAIDCRATPTLAREMIAAARSVDEAPITQLFLTHYHAVRVMGRAAFTDAHTVFASDGTLSLIQERGAEDFASEVRRFPRLFADVEEVPGLTSPDVTFGHSLRLWKGLREIRLMHVGRGHTLGDSVAWLPQERILFAGDLIEASCALYCGDGYLQAWRDTLDALATLSPRVVVPGRGAAITNESDVRDAIAQTRGFLDALLRLTQEGIDAGHDLKGTFDHVYDGMTPVYGQWPIYEHCIPFNVSRAFDELRGVEHPEVWTAERDEMMWDALQG